jgi:thiamine biosynthesis lipoprotein
MKYLSFLIIFSSIIIFSCNSPKEPVMVKFTGETQGTYYAITYYDTEALNLKPQVDSILKALDQSVSLWAPSSIISRINKAEENVEPDEIFSTLFRKSEEVYKQSNGAFDPTVGPVVNAWGFGFTDRLKVDQHIIDSLLPLVGFDKVKLENNKIMKSDPRIQFDFNAIAQGYSVDLIGHFLQEKGISRFLIDVGGEVLARGNKPTGEKWRVGIEKPKDNASYGEGLQAIVNLEDKALSTSGNYRKFYEENGVRYSHTIDPKTGYPVQHSLLSVSVLAEDCATADAYATVFMVLGTDKSKEFISGRKDLNAYFIYTNENGNLSTYSTEGFEKLLAEDSK